MLPACSPTHLMRKQASCLFYDLTEKLVYPGREEGYVIIGIGVVQGLADRLLRNRHPFCNISLTSVEKASILLVLKI